MYKFDESYIRNSPSKTNQRQIKIQLYLDYQVQRIHLCTLLTYRTIQTLCEYLFFDMCRFTMYTPTFSSQSFKCNRSLHLSPVAKYDQVGSVGLQTLEV